MNFGEIKPGSLFKQDATSEHYHWVVGIDELMAMCIGGPRDPREYFKRPLAMMAYGPCPLERFKKRQRVEDVPLTEKELKAHRPDLPLRLLRNPTLNWGNFLGKLKLEDVTQTANQGGLDLAQQPELTAAEIVLAVIPAPGGWRKATKFAALSGKSFSPGEVLWRASQVFEMEGLEADDGIGVFRAGINKKVPFFLVGGYHDLAGITYRFENPDAPIMQSSEMWKLRRRKPTGDFVTRLKGFKASLPFAQWVEKRDAGMEQYTSKNCAAVQRAFTQLIDALIKAGEVASKDIKLSLFDEAMDKLNRLNGREPELFETEEREQLCSQMEDLAETVGLSVDKDETGESRITVGRDW